VRVAAAACRVAATGPWLRVAARVAARITTTALPLAMLWITRGTAAIPRRITSGVWLLLLLLMLLLMLLRLLLMMLLRLLRLLLLLLLLLLPNGIG